MQLSKHFTLREMTNSMTAQRKGIDNTPGAGEIKSLGDLCYEVLEPLRAHFDKAVTITSGYRSEALCEAIGSKKTSQHAKGQAVDLEIFGVPNIKTAYWLQNNVDFDQLIMEYFDKNPSSLDTIRAPLIEQKVIDSIISKSKTNVIKLTEDDYKKLEVKTFDIKDTKK